jgi:hypothetical protein
MPCSEMKDLEAACNTPALRRTVRETFASNGSHQRPPVQRERGVAHIAQPHPVSSCVEPMIV